MAWRDDPLRSLSCANQLLCIKKGEEEDRETGRESV